MTNEQTRADFEAFYKLTDATADFQREAINGDAYYFDDEQVAWQFWQAATAKANQWRPIADAPKDGTLILVREARCSCLAVMRLGGWKYESGGICYIEPTHWQPLPLPPTGTQPDQVATDHPG